MPFDEAMAVVGLMHGKRWARHLATASELVRADCLMAGGFNEEAFSLNPATMFVEAIRPGCVGPPCPVCQFKQEVEALPGCGFLADVSFVGGFCQGASEVWRAGHFGY